MRRLDPFDKKAMLLSVVLHGGILTAAWLSTRHHRPQFEFLAYEIELVSPPPAVQAAQPAPAQQQLVVEKPRPEPVREPPKPEPEKVQVEKPQPEPPKPQPAPEPTPPKPEVEQTSTPAVTDVPPEKPPENPGEGINVRMEGLKRDYPQYYNNIISQILRCFRWRNGGSWQASVTFVIHRDGSVGDLEFAKRSGSTSFDFEAMGAIDCAGQGRLGPLPDDLPWESLPVLFQFSPSGGG
jgi:outer membrane biosynthesis protein TonB